MKNYLNKEEQCNHFIIILCSTIMDNLINGNGVSTKEKQLLSQAKKKIEEFSSSVFERLGQGYVKSMKNKARDNTICVTERTLSGKSPVKPMADTLDHEEIVELLDLCSDYECIGCERTDCISCQIYRMKSHLNYDGKSEDNDLCPFRKEKTADLFDFEF